MFEDIFFVLILSAVAAAVILGVFIGRKMLSVVGAKSDIEATRMKIELDKLQYQRTINQHSQKEALTVLANKALPVGENLAAPDDLPKASEDLPEVLKTPKNDDIQERYTRVDIQDYKQRRDAPDAEFEPIGP